MHKVFLELLPCSRPASDPGDKAGLALLLFHRRVRQKASKQTQNKCIYSLERK